MLPLLRSEIFRASAARSTAVLLGMQALIVLALYLLLYSVVNAQAQMAGMDPEQAAQAEAALAQLRELLPPSGLAEFGLSFAQGVGAVLLVIFAAMSIGGEYEHRTLRTLLPRAPGRASLLLAKAVLIFGFGLALVVAGLLAAAAGSIFVAWRGGMDLGVPEGFLAHLAASAGRTWFTLLPYAAIAFAISTWLRSGGFGIGLGLAAYFAESIVVQLLGQLAPDLAFLGDYGLARNVQGVTGLNAGVRISGPGMCAPLGELPDPQVAALILAAYTLGAILIAIVRFQRRDLTLA